MKKLLALVFMLLMGVILVIPAMADTAGYGANQSALTTPAASNQKQGKKGHRHVKKQHKKKADASAATQK